MAAHRVKKGAPPPDPLFEQTHWQVITGAPCSGKTSVIAELALRGFQVVPEVARDYIDTQLAMGLSLDLIKADLLSFERHILHAKVNLERHLPRKATIFMDRAVPDSVAYFQLDGLDATEPLGFSTLVRYEKIFLLERLSFEKDAVRSENDRAAAHLEYLLRQVYEQLGYAVITIPVMTIAQRVALILNSMTDRSIDP